MGNVEAFEVRCPSVELSLVRDAEGEVVEASATVIEGVAAPVIRLAKTQNEATFPVVKKDARSPGLSGRQSTEDTPSEHSLVPLGTRVHVAHRESHVRGPSNRRHGGDYRASGA